MEPEIAQAFCKIAEVEQHYEARYRKLYANLINGEVFKRSAVAEWKCEKYGLCIGVEALPRCVPRVSILGLI
jgi:rubrerythrin